MSRRSGAEPAAGPEFEAARKAERALHSKGKLYDIGPQVEGF